MIDHIPAAELAAVVAANLRADKSPKLRNQGILPLGATLLVLGDPKQDWNPIVVHCSARGVPVIPVFRACPTPPPFPDSDLEQLIAPINALLQQVNPQSPAFGHIWANGFAAVALFEGGQINLIIGGVTGSGSCLPETDLAKIAVWLTNRMQDLIILLIRGEPFEIRPGQTEESVLSATPALLAQPSKPILSAVFQAMADLAAPVFTALQGHIERAAFPYPLRIIGRGEAQPQFGRPEGTVLVSRAGLRVVFQPPRLVLRSTPYSFFAQRGHELLTPVLQWQPGLPLPQLVEVVDQKVATAQLPAGTIVIADDSLGVVMFATPPFQIAI